MPRNITLQWQHHTLFMYGPLCHYPYQASFFLEPNKANLYIEFYVYIQLYNQIPGVRNTVFVCLI